MEIFAWKGAFFGRFFDLFSALVIFFTELRQAGPFKLWFSKTIHYNGLHMPQKASHLKHLLPSYGFLWRFVPQFLIREKYSDHNWNLSKLLRKERTTICHKTHNLVEKNPWKAFRVKFWGVFVKKGQKTRIFRNFCLAYPFFNWSWSHAQKSKLDKLYLYL